MSLEFKTAFAVPFREKDGTRCWRVRECPYCGRVHHHPLYKNRSASVEPTLGSVVQAGCEGLWRGGSRKYRLEQE